MKYIALDYDQAHAVVERNIFLEWDEYTIVTRRKSATAYTDPRGVYKNGEWWLQFRYALRNDGTWKVPENYVNR